MEYDTENIDVRSRMDDMAHAIQAMSAVSRLSQTHNGHMFSQKPDTKIVALLKTGLGELKHCRNEQQCIQFLVGLSLVMPPQREEGHSMGWIRRITHALAVKRSKRTAKYVEEWNPTQDADASQPQVAMLINSSKLRAARFTLREVNPPAPEAAARGSRRKYGAGLHQLQGMGPKRVVLSADNDNEFRSQCEKLCFC